MRKTTLLDDILLFEDFRHGDIRAFSRYYRGYSRLLFLFTHKIIGPASVSRSDIDPGSIVADSFVRLWQNRDKIQSPNHLKNFLLVTARNLTLNVLAARKVAETTTLSDEIPALDDNAVEKERVLAEMIFQLWQIADEMPKRMKEVFLLRYKAGKSAREVADLLQIKVSTVHDQVKKALQFMRDSLPSSFWENKELFAVLIGLCYGHITPM